MKLSEYKGMEALEVLEALIDPAIEIMSDPDVAQAAREGQMAKVARAALKNHKKSILAVLAAAERRDPEEYAKEVNVLTLPKKLVDVLNDPEIMALFTSQGQTETASSGSASGNTKARKK